MKTDYTKPEITISEEKKFERVYAGGCNKNINPGHAGGSCVWNDNWYPHDSEKHNAHTKPSTNLDPELSSR